VSRVNSENQPKLKASNRNEVLELREMQMPSGAEVFMEATMFIESRSPMAYAFK